MGFEGDEELATIPTKSTFRYNSPLVQVSLIGLVCFCCPGMFNALSGMGGGGQVDHTAANNANTALYTTFAVFGILGGGIYNILGPRLTLVAGCSTYVLYAGSFLYYNHHKHQDFAIVAGALLGVGAGLLWAAQGAIMTSYPPTHRKGTYISLFWSIFNMGGVIGGLIPFILNYHRGEAASVNDGTYIGFMAFMAAGALISLAILPPSKVIRNDGTRCSNIKYSNVSTEAIEIFKLFLNWKMLLIVPAAWSSNFFYTYQFNNVNGALFNLRTRGFNNVFYWGAQMLGSVGIGYIMDFSFQSRRMRGFVGISVVGVLGTAIWAGGLANQLRYSRDDKLEKLFDFKDSGADFAGPFVLYFSYGLLDAMFQSMVYWVIGALANDSEILSRYSGFYKGVQSAGAAVAWQVDTHNVSFMSQLIVNWCLTTVAYPLLVVLVVLAVKDEVKAEKGTTEEAIDCYLILRTSKVLVDQDPGLTGNLLVERLVGAHIDLISKEEYAKIGSESLTDLLKEKLLNEGRRPYVIPVGGSNSLGTWGYIEAIREIEQQLQTGTGEIKFDDIVVACGSGGTIAGLSLGSWLSTLKAKVHAFSVCDDPDYFYDFIQGLLNGLEAGVDSRDIVNIHNAKGLGYAINTSEELKFVKEVAAATGVVLDPVYSGKAAYGLMKDMAENPKKWEGRKILFIHTGGLLGLFDKVEQMASFAGNWRRMDVHEEVPRRDGTGKMF